MPIQNTGSVPSCYAAMPPPPPPTVAQLRRTAAGIGARLDELYMLHRVTGDPDVLVDAAHISGQYTRVLQQLSSALLREQQASAFGASFANT